MNAIRLFAVSFFILFSAISKPQNILTCELNKNYRKKSVFKIENDENQVIAKIYQQKRNYIIENNDMQYLIQKRGKMQYVFHDSVFTDTVAVLTNRSLSLRKIGNYTIKRARSGWRINEGEDLEMNIKYNPQRKVYVIKIHTPIYEENILNLLACYYAIRKCKDIIQQNNSANGIVYLLTTGII
jgi:hypothetical protein